jgi:L-ascorbate metabolism protein UlaG (beta-lactamase superfamily)
MGTHVATSSLSLTFAGHSTVLLEMDGVRLLTDPLLRRRIGVLIRRSPVPPPAVRRDLDAVLIPHARLTPAVDVRILRPGESTVFTPAVSGGEAARE